MSGVPQIGLYFESWGVVLIDKLRRDLLEQSSGCSEMHLNVRTKDAGREVFLMESSTCHVTPLQLFFGNLLWKKKNTQKTFTNGEHHKNAWERLQSNGLK